MISSCEMMDAKRALNKIGTKNVTTEIAQTDLGNGDVSERGMQTLLQHRTPSTWKCNMFGKFMFCCREARIHY
jgi:hypothetical protein